MGVPFSKFGGWKGAWQGRAAHAGRPFQIYFPDDFLFQVAITFFSNKKSVAGFSPV
jgi:hypothetical protein